PLPRRQSRNLLDPLYVAPGRGAEDLTDFAIEQFPAHAGKLPRHHRRDHNSVQVLLLHSILCELGNLLQKMWKKLPGDDAAVGGAQHVQHASFDSLQARKAAAASAAALLQTAEIADFIAYEGHSVVVKIGDKDIRRSINFMPGLQYNVFRVNVKSVAVLALPGQGHELA